MAVIHLEYAPCVQVCWEKFCEYFEVEARYVPVTEVWNCIVVRKALQRSTAALRTTMSFGSIKFSSCLADDHAWALTVHTMLCDAEASHQPHTAQVELTDDT